LTGNVFVTGYYQSPSITFDTITLNNVLQPPGIYYNNAFVVKYKADGTMRWVRSISGERDEKVNNITTDALGNIYVTGVYNSQNTYVGNSFVPPCTSAPLNFDIFVGLFTTNGYAWVVLRYGGTGDDTANNLITDSDGNIYITGYSQSPDIQFSQVAPYINKTGVVDAFVVSFDMYKFIRWQNHPTGTGSNYGQAACVDSHGKVYVTGYFESPTYNFGSINLPNSGNFDVFVAKIDGTTGIDETTFSNSSTLFPNPTSDILNIKSTNLKANSNIEITNAYGQVVLSEKGTTGNAKVNMQHLPSGIYFAKITNANGVVEINKVVKR